MHRPCPGHALHYLSTRGAAPRLDFDAALMLGLAEDGGLTMPEHWPRLSADTIAAFAAQPYATVARTVMQPFIGAAPDAAAFEAIVAESYAGFAHAATAPLVQIGRDEFILELFHGPTLAFKDVAMQLIARLMDASLARTGGHAVILGATSGDTGAAAVEALKGRHRLDLFMLYPHGRIAAAQRRQMTTAGAPNVHILAVDGDFDACQRLVKLVFADASFRRDAALTAVNSINWARIMAQSVYYFTAAASLGAPARPVAFAVPTGNFGDVFAGYVAARMGLPIARLLLATNENDILQRALATGRYEPRQTVATSSSAMDIQVASNFERLIFEASERDAPLVASCMEALRVQGGFTLPADTLARMTALLAAERVDEATVEATIAEVWRSAGYLADPHTAVAIAAARRRALPPGVPRVILATAHPAKFPEAIRRAAGIEPAVPERLAQALQGAEREQRVAADPEAIKALIRNQMTRQAA